MWGLSRRRRRKPCVRLYRNRLGMKVRLGMVGSGQDAREIAELSHAATRFGQANKS